MTENWIKIDTQGENFKFEEDGQTLEGKLSLVGPGKFENSKVYIIEKENGTAVRVFGAVILDDKMSQVEIGEYIKIEYKGKVKTGSGKMAGMYEVYTRNEKTTEEETAAEEEAKETAPEETAEAAPATDEPASTEGE